MTKIVTFKADKKAIASASKEIGEISKRYETLSKQFLEATNDVANDWIGNESQKYIKSIQSLSSDLSTIVKYLNGVSSNMMDQRNCYVKADEEVDGIIPNRK